MGKHICCICGKESSSKHDDKWYCNKHWLRIYYHGTPDLIGRKNTNKFVIENGKLEITTAKGKVIIADAEDYKILCKYSWCISKTGYAVANIDKKVTKLHRYLLGITDKRIIVDHKNGNPLDNRRNNLRICNAQENARNCKASKSNLTGVLGVSFIKKSGRYRARIMVDRKEIRLGNFKTLEEAKKAREAAELKYFGEYAPYASRDNEPRAEITIFEI